MKARQAVVCLRCGAYNRPNWEYCARCNESLEGARPAEAESAPAIGAGELAAPAGPVNLVSLAAMLALGLGVVAAWRYAATAPPPARPDPAMFTIATVPPPLPTESPSTQAGAADYEAGRRLLTKGDLQGAIGRLAAAVAADPWNAEYHNVLGHALWRSGDRERALAEHADAARLDPRLQMQYARSLDVAGHTAEAVEQYEAILALNPDATTVHEDLGRLLFRTGDYAKAAAHLSEAVERRSDDPVLQQELAYSLDQAGNRAQAAAVYRQVLETAPNAVLTRGLLADNLSEQGKTDEAVAVLQQGLERTPDAPLLERQLGAVLERSGRGSEAASAYRRYARLAPNAPDANEIVARAARLEARERTP